MKTLNWTFQILVISLILLSCYPDGPENIEEETIVYTQYTENIDFSSLSTYTLPDSIPVFSNRQNPDFLNSTFADPILSSLRANLDDYGWQEADSATRPDATLLPSVVSTTSYYNNINNWNWYYQGYGGYYYPGYFPAIQRFQSNTLIIRMTDTTASNTNGQLPIFWNVVIDGALQGNTQDITDRLRSTIDQAFDQTPVLDQN